MARKWLITILTIFCTLILQAQGTGKNPAVISFVTDDNPTPETVVAKDRAGEEMARQRLAYYLANYQVALIQIRSGSSPDGNTDSNRQRSDQRAAAALNWLAGIDGIDIDSVPCETRSVGEDYETLATLLQDSDIPGAQEAIHIIETVPIWVTQGGKVVDSRKRQLMNVQRGATWNLMREELFPELQQTQIVFDFEKPGANSRTGVSRPIRIYFPLNDHVLHVLYHTNTQALRDLDSLLRAREYTHEDVIQVVGYSSPEGIERHNYKLAERRAESIRKYVEQTCPEFSGTLMVRSGGEAWVPFRKLVQQDSELSEETREKMLDIIDSDIDPDSKEAKLKQFSTWSSYVRNQFRDFRVAIVTSFYPELSEDSIPAIEDLSDLDWLSATQAISLRPDNLTIPPLTEKKRTLRPVLGLSTNLLYDVTYIPNYGLTSIPSFSLEYYPLHSSHFTFGADVEWSMWQHWDEYRFQQINIIGLWSRYYFKKQEDRFRGFYMSGTANAARFGLGWDAKGWEGEGLGASLGLGYKWILGKSRLFIDLGITGGFFYMRYDPYVYGFDATERYYYDYDGDPDLFQRRNHRLLWGGPTRVYFSIGIDLFNRNRR